MMELERMLRGRMGRDEDEDTRLPEAVISDLKEVFESYKAFLKECPFKPGDIVTPKAGYAMNDAGRPHVVLEIRRNFFNDQAKVFEAAPEPHFTDEPGSNSSGRRQDMRIACFRGGNRVTHWVESFEFEDYLAAEKRKLERTSAAMKAA